MAIHSDCLFPAKAAGWDATVLPDGRWLLYNASNSIAQPLTAPAGILWELCDGQTTIEDILAELERLYPDTAYAVLAAETKEILQKFVEEGLITCGKSA